jgi:predicted dehydrogenase
LGVEEGATSSGADDPLAIDYNLHKTQINEIVEAILKGFVPPVDSEDAMRSVALIEGIYDSSKNGERIVFTD